MRSADVLSGLAGARQISGKTKKTKKTTKTTRTESETEKMVTIQLSPARNARHCPLWKVRGAPPPGLHRNLSQTCPVSKLPVPVLRQIPVKLNSYKKRNRKDIDLKGIKWEAKDLRRAVVVAIASLLMAMNIKTFVRTGGLYPGGATGLTILIQRIALQYFSLELPYSIINILLNAFPVYIGFRFIGKKFTIFSCEMILLTSFLTDLIPARPITYDTLLISIFGGLINGFVMTMCLRVNATTGGTDFISIYLSQKRGVDSFNIILGFNAVILLAAGYFFGWDKALYSIIFQYTSTQILRLLYRNYQQETLFIVTDKWNEVKNAIHETTHHGSTIWAAEGGYKEDWRNVVYSVVARSDVKRVTEVIQQIDPDAFINAIPTERILGRFHQEKKD